jgi:predicted Fe-S protein YdhL (DUF1289 family)
VGICSTTYGDLVCRGCKRFAHEIVQWNGFEDEQRQLVWDRLRKLCEGAVLSHLSISDEVLLREVADGFKVPERDILSLPALAYEVLRRSRNRNDLAALGILPHESTVTPAELYQRVERELFDRSVAQYERDFHIPAQ